MADAPSGPTAPGGGAIGPEKAAIRQALGLRVMTAEMIDQSIPGAEKGAVAPPMERAGERRESIHIAPGAQAPE